MMDTADYLWGWNFFGLQVRTVWVDIKVDLRKLLQGEHVLDGSSNIYSKRYIVFNQI